MMRQVTSVRAASAGLLALVATGAVLRWGFHTVVRFGNGDEYHYRLQTAAIHAHGWSFLRELAQWHLVAEPDFPAPYRWGTLLFGNVACSIRHVCDERSLAWVSTLSGVAVVALVGLLALRLFSRRVALFATALAVTSPLHLELGRRAYADELHTALVLLSMLALSHVAEAAPSPKPARSRVWLGIALLAMTLAWSVKESILFMLPALGVWLWRLRSPAAFSWKDALTLVAPAALSLLVFAAVNRGLSNLPALFEATRQSLHHPYSIAFQAGPPHRPLVELFTLSPGVFALLPVAVAAALGVLPSPGLGERRQPKALAVTLLLMAAAFAILPKNIRFCAVLDPLARLLVAWFACEVLPHAGRSVSLWCASALLGNAAFELALFHRTFVASSVTDPTAHAIFRALQMIPADTRRWHPTVLMNLCSLGSAGLACSAAWADKLRRKSVIAGLLVSLLAFVSPRLLRPAQGAPSAATSNTMLAAPANPGPTP